jgi:diguanylate cyclase (GGDEF)-like protein/PAS domain S-box-containing protein
MPRLATHLATRIGLAAMALAAAVALLWLSEFDNHRRTDLLGHRGAELQDSMRLHASQIGQAVETLRQDTLFLARTPPVSGIVRASRNHGIDPRDNNPIETWRQRLREIFTAFATAHPAYFQIRYIGIADGGRELVRAERQGDHVVAVADPALQQKGDRDYFIETVALADGEIHLSEFDLNREHGAIQVPHIRTLRAATPVFDPDGRVFGIVIVNMDAGPLFDTMRPGRYDADVLSYVLDQRGHFLLHPVPEREFGWELGRAENPEREFPALGALLAPEGAAEIPLHPVDGANGRLHLAAKRIPIDPAAPSRFLLLAHAVPDAAIEAELAPSRSRARIAILLMMLGIGVLVFIGLHMLLRPLRRLTEVADAIAGGARDVRLPDSSVGEIGALTGAFRAMQAKVAEREADLERRVRARTAELRLAASVVDNTSEGVAVVDESTRIVSVNAAFTAITGYTAEEAVGQKPNLLKSDHHPPEFYQSMWQALNADGRWQGEIWNRRKDGALYLEWLTINRIEAIDGIPVHYVSVFHDITELRRKDEHIHHLAYHDILTELFQDRLQHAIARALREDTGLALMFLDLDRFKGINDTLGHDIGDLLLKEVAVRLKSALRSMDTVARLGGDEFVILLEDVDVPDYGANIAANLVEAVARPMEIQGHAIQIGASIGIALCPEDGCDALELMKHADTAMYAAKAAGRNTYRFFRQEMTDQAARRHQLEMELRHAVANNELELHYQPKVCLATGRFDSVEALVRWRHPRLGLVPPVDFIPVAEETGLIVDIGDWVLERACAQAIEWKARHLDFGIAVNVSAKQLQRGDLVERIANLAACHNVAPTCLQIELTESVLMADPELAIGQLRRLRELGVTIAVDDFGTGYSSLAYLRRLPIDVLKIDRSFVMDADHDDEDAQVVRTIVELGRSLKFTVVAEGVETEAQADLLRSAGCDLAQGYLYARPETAERLEAWLAARG